MDAPNVMGIANSEPGCAVNGVEAIAILASDDHTKKSMITGQVDMLRDITFRAPAMIQFTDSAIVHARSETLQGAHSDVETQEHEGTATTEPVKNTTGVSTLPSERTYSLPASDKSLNHQRPIALRYQDGPPKSSEINATIVPKVRRVPTNDNESQSGCFNFFRHGSRRREKPGRMANAKVGSATKHSNVEHLYGVCNEGTQRLGEASLQEGAESEAPRQRGAQGYHRLRTLPELAKQESVNYPAASMVSGDWRALGHADFPNPSGVFDQLSPRSPYDMRYGAVQPQYFRTEETAMYRQIAPAELQHQSPVQRRTSGGSTGSSPSYVRSGTTLSTSSSTRRKALVDLTPQYQPPPQHRHKGHGYYPEQLGSGKLVDYATSPKNESSTPFALD